MKPPFNPDAVIACRRFERDDGSVDLRIHQPLPWPSDAVDREPDWVCWYSISYPHGETMQRSTAGADSIQALLLAFAAAKGDLTYLRDGTPTRRPPIRWLDSDDLGLTITHFD